MSGGRAWRGVVVADAGIWVPEPAAWRVRMRGNGKKAGTGYVGGGGRGGRGRGAGRAPGGGRRGGPARKSPPHLGADVPLPERLRLTLERLGPTFVKAGQMLALRPDYVPL